MKTKTYIPLLTVFLLSLFPALAWAVCTPPLFFGQVWEDYIVGLNPENSAGFIIIDGVADSLTPLNPSDLLFPWENGDYLWGLWGDGVEEGYCPDPASLEGSRAVVAIASDKGSTRRFFIQSAWWDDEAWLFNMDSTSGTIHTAGSLDVPHIIDESEHPGYDNTVSIAVDLPVDGFADDGSSDPRSLAAGVALVGAKSWPGSETDLWQPLAFLPVTPSSWPTLQVTIPLPEGTNLVAWTLVVDDGSGRDLSLLPTLPMVSPPLTLRLPEGNGNKLYAAVEIDHSADQPLLNRISASGENGTVTVRWKTRGNLEDNSTFEIWASADGENFSLQDRVDPNDAVRMEDDTRTYEWQQFLGERSSVGGLYYEVQWVDDTGIIITSKWTRARWRD